MAADKMLVAYATRYGTTREVAERIAGVLSDLGWAVDEWAHAAGAALRVAG